jgi:hypothetical protein
MSSRQKTQRRSKEKKMPSTNQTVKQTANPVELIVRADGIQTYIANQRMELAGAVRPRSSDKVFLFPPTGRRKDVVVARIIFDDGSPVEQTLLAIVAPRKDGSMIFQKFHRQRGSREKPVFMHMVNYDGKIMSVAFSPYQRPTPDQWENGVTKQAIEFADPA